MESGEWLPTGLQGRCRPRGQPEAAVCPFLSSLTVSKPKLLAKSSPQGGDEMHQTLTWGFHTTKASGGSLISRAKLEAESRQEQSTGLERSSEIHLFFPEKGCLDSGQLDFLSHVAPSAVDVMVTLSLDLRFLAINLNWMYALWLLCVSAGRAPRPSLQTAR